MEKSKSDTDRLPMKEIHFELKTFLQNLNLKILITGFNFSVNHVVPNILLAAQRNDPHDDLSSAQRSARDA